MRAARLNLKLWPVLTPAFFNSLCLNQKYSGVFSLHTVPVLSGPPLNNHCLIISIHKEACVALKLASG